MAGARRLGRLTHDPGGKRHRQHRHPIGGIRIAFEEGANNGVGLNIHRRLIAPYGVFNKGQNCFVFFACHAQTKRDKTRDAQAQKSRMEEISPGVLMTNRLIYKT